MNKLGLDANSWAELDRLLDRALDLPVEQRAQWIASLGPEFDELRPRLAELLSSALPSAGFLEKLPPLDVRPSEPPPDAHVERAGDTIGAYRLVRELGVGGMGTVWLAERVDGLMARSVALKLPHGAWKRAGLVERMGRERAILATLTHPNIARLYDAGLTPDGQPYLALEFVAGEPIDAYLRARTLSTSEKLALFVQVANAVAYAHSQLVIHRDLKPANIMVTADGQVRLLDFGIAKLLDDGRATATRLTELSGRALTIDYASPEQILGEPLTIASDVYSLGVVLYEMLTGERPYKLSRDTRGALEEAIVQTDPAPPSAVVERRRRSELQGDLDTIVLKALRKSTQERYSTVHALLDDIERHRTGRPVLARSDGAWYRLCKFAARNKLIVGAAASVLAAIVIGAFIAAWQARVAIAERNRAEAVNDFIGSIFREADPNGATGDVLSAVGLLRQAEERLQERTFDERTKLELLTIIAESQFGLQQNAEAARVASDALKLEATSTVTDPLLQSRLHLVLSQSYEYLGRNDDALAELQRAKRELVDAGQTRHPLFVQVTLHEAALGLALQNYATTERAAEDAIELAKQLIGPRSAEVATGLQFLSHAYVFTKRSPLAVERSREAYELMQALHRNDLTHPKVIDSAMYYTRALSDVGEFDAAAGVIEVAIANAVRKFGDDNRLVGELYSMAVPPDLERGALRSAVDSARRSLEIHLREAQHNTGVHAYRARLLGHTLLAARTDDALPTLEAAIDLTARSGKGVALVIGQASLGMALSYAGRLEEGQALLQATLDGAPPGSRVRSLALRYLGTTARLNGDAARAVELLGQTITDNGGTGLYRNELAAAFAELGLARLAVGDVDLARAAFERSATLFETSQHANMTPARAELLVGMARVAMYAENNADALNLLATVDAFWRDFHPTNRAAGEAAYWRGECLRLLERPSDAGAAFKQARALLARSTIPTDVELVKRAR